MKKIKPFVTLRGRFEEAVIFTDTAEEEALKQIKLLLDQRVSAGTHVRIMPDCHAGAGCVIGYTARLGEAVIPNLIGVDIGCGVCAWNFGDVPLQRSLFESLDRYIRQSIPSGFKTRDGVSPLLEEAFELCGGNRTAVASFRGFEKAVVRIVKKTGQEDARVWRSLGTLGGGNHFIEIDKDDEGRSWLTVHTGSRNFGLKIAGYHQNIAKNERGGECPKGLEYLTGAAMKEYTEDMEIAQLYAAINRFGIGMDILTSFFNLSPDKQEHVESVHNYINFKDGIVRKGAISAHKNEAVIIPLNMAEGCILGRGKGEKDWNQSAPHGAGRALSRTKAKEKIPLAEYRKIMENQKVWSSCISKDTLDESPQAYKRSRDIIDSLESSVTVERFLKSVYNFKAPG